MKSKMKNIVEWVTYILAGVLLATLLQSQIFSITQVHQSSMEDTLTQGQRLMMEKISYRFTSPKQGDIIVFIQEGKTDSFFLRLEIFWSDVRGLITRNPRQDRLIKRIIAVEGDLVSFQNGLIYINEVLLDEPYVKNSTIHQKESERVPEGAVYVLGDNRQVSLDSRNFGPVPMDQIEGKILFQ